MQAGLADGSLAEERLESYRKLQRELRHLELKTDPRALAERPGAPPLRSLAEEVLLLTCMELGPTPETDTGRLSRIGILRPLRIRDFALLWAGATVSLAGDGVYVVALAWQVYELSDSPTALQLVGVAWTLPVGLFVLLGGVVSDRFERRRIMIAADLVRAAAAATIGALSLTGEVELWHLIALAAVFGTGEAFFGPAFMSIVPQIVPRDLLLQANSLDQFIRPFAFLLVGRPWAAGWWRRWAQAGLRPRRVHVRRLGVRHLPHPASRHRA